MAGVEIGDFGSPSETRTPEKTTIEIVRVHSFGPAVAKLLVKRSSREVEPTFAKKRAKFVRAGYPGHYGRRVREISKPIFGLAEDLYFLEPFFKKRRQQKKREIKNNQEHL